MGKISVGEKVKLFALFCVFYGIFYLIPNFLPVFEPRLLPLTDFERSLPLVPLSFLIYVSDYILLAVVVMGTKDRERWDPFVRQAFGLLMFCGLIFFFLPTTYPRPEYPDVGGLSGLIMYLVRNGDTPNNCFPSMHVAITSLAMWTVREWPKRLRYACYVWGISIFVSTLLTKQHYLWDILGGVLACSFVVWTDHKFAPRFARLQRA